MSSGPWLQMSGVCVVDGLLMQVKLDQCVYRHRHKEKLNINCVNNGRVNRGMKEGRVKKKINPFVIFF